MEERSGWPEASPEVLEDCVHAVSLNLQDDLPESPCEVSYGFLFLLYSSLQRANVPFLSYQTKILRDECSPKLIDYAGAYGARLAQALAD